MYYGGNISTGNAVVEGNQWRGLLLALRRSEATGEYVL